MAALERGTIHEFGSFAVMEDKCILSLTAGFRYLRLIGDEQSVPLWFLEHQGAWIYIPKSVAVDELEQLFQTTLARECLTENRR